MLSKDLISMEIKPKCMGWQQEQGHQQSLFTFVSLPWVPRVRVGTPSVTIFH